MIGLLEVFLLFVLYMKSVDLNALLSEIDSSYQAHDRYSNRIFVFRQTSNDNIAFALVLASVVLPKVSNSSIVVPYPSFGGDWAQIGWL